MGHYKCKPEYHILLKCSCSKADTYPGALYRLEFAYIAAIAVARLGCLPVLTGMLVCRCGLIRPTEVISRGLSAEEES